MKMKNKQLLGILSVGCGATSLGASGAIAQYMFNVQHVNSLWVVGARTIIGGFLLLMVYAIGHPHDLFKIWRDKRDGVQLVLFAFFGILPSQAVYFFAIVHSNASTATILQFTAPVFIIIYVSLTQRKLPNHWSIISILLALTGTIFIATQGHFDTLAISTLGLVFGLGAGISGASYTLLPIRLLKKYDARLVCGWGMIINTIPMLPIVIAIPAPHFTPNIILELGYIVIFGTILSYLLMLTSLHYVSPVVTGMLNAFEPLTATLLSIIFLHLELNGTEVMGGILILAMAMIQSLSARQK
ncbi:EamA family transporter [Lactobacillaceae bacterium Melli_B4]